MCEAIFEIRFQKRVDVEALLDPFVVNVEAQVTTSFINFH